MLIQGGLIHGIRLFEIVRRDKILYINNILLRKKFLYYIVLKNYIHGGNHMRIKRITKAIVCMSLALSIVCGQYIPASAQERNDWKYTRVSDETALATIVVEENADYEVVLVITGVDEESGDAYGHFSVRSDIYGFVNADGVRLRTRPSLSATILGEMYCDDLVIIHEFIHNEEGDWMRITRDEPQQEGYVYAIYVDPYPYC